MSERPPPDLTYKDVTANPNGILSQTSNTGILLQDSPTYTSRSSRPLEETIIGRRWGPESSTFGWAFLSPYTRAHGQLGITAVPTSPTSPAKSDPAIAHRARRKPCFPRMAATGVRSKTETSAEVPDDPSPLGDLDQRRTLTGQDQAHVS